MTLSNMTLNEDRSAKLDLMSICQRTVKQKKISNVPRDALMCPLQIINDIEPLSSTIHGLIGCFIHHRSNVKITRAAISRKPIDQMEKKKTIFNYIFLHLDEHLWLKNQNRNGRKPVANFLRVHNLHFTAH